MINNNNNNKRNNNNINEIFFVAGFSVIGHQAVCEWGRDSVESWGRRRRSVSSAQPSNNDTSENSEDMTQISQEILVLDFGDEKQSQFLKSNEPQYTDFNKGK